MRNPLGVAVSAALIFTAVPAQALDILSGSEIAERERKQKLQAKPVLSCSPRELSARAVRGETAELRLTIRNGGGQVLRWSLSRLPPWLAADVVTGELRFGEERAVVLHVRTQLVPSGTRAAEVLVEAPGAEGSPARVRVAVDVRPAPIAPGPAPRAPEPAEEMGPEPVADLAAPRVKRFTARAGLIIPGSASDEERETGLLIGAAYDLPFLRTEKLVIEASADFGSLSDESGARSSTMVMLSGTARYLLTGGGLYVMGGGSVVLESYSSDASGTDGTNLGSLLGLGIGVRPGAGSLDLRLSHQVLLGSDNVGGLTSFTAGYSF